MTDQRTSNGRIDRRGSGRGDAGTVSGRLHVAVAVVAAVTSLGFATPAALAWGRLGHRASAHLAEARLTPGALEAVRALLEPGESLADASTWADEVRRDRPESGPWHYVNVPLAASRYSERFRPAGGCVVSKVEEFRRVLADPDAPLVRRREALRFLVHLVQDLHQPVHVGDRNDRGGNDLQVRWLGNGSNLHRVWDSELFAVLDANEADLTRELARQAARPEAEAWASGSVEDWANESLAAARRAYLDPESGEPLRRGARLGEAYADLHLPVARRRVAQSGVRLAWILNTTFATPR